MAKSYGIDPHGKEYDLLLKIENSPHHFIPCDALTAEEDSVIDFLLSKRWIEYVRAGHSVTQNSHYAPRLHTKTKNHLPDRYVITSGGSYALGTFDMDTLREEGY
jgi:hypothetical protein